ncbi:MAG: hypothetical protein WCW87_00490 [Candidatus Paceibacterota bacterium]
MSKKTTALTIIIFLIVLIGGLIIFYYLFLNQGGNISQLNPLNSEFDPFGSTNNSSNTNTQNNYQSSQNQNNNTSPTYQNGTTTLPRLRQISNTAIAGAITIKKTNDNDLVRFMEKSTGHVFEAQTNYPEIKEISNTTIPKIYEAKWVEKGEAVLIRYNKDNTESVDTFYAKLQPTSIKASTTPQSTQPGEQVTEKELNGNFLTQDIKEIALSPLKDMIFYLQETSDSSQGVSSKPDGTKKQGFFQSAIKSWLISWPQTDIVAFQTKPSASVPGFLFFLSKGKSTFEKQIGNINGMTSLVSPDLAHIIFSVSQGDTFSLYHRIMKSGKDESLTITTLPEKCVWSKKETATLYCAIPREIPKALYPDDWYQGSVTFTDELWKINLNNSVFKIVSSPVTENSKNIDAVSLFLNDSETYLFFTNKKDSILWSLKLN